MKRTIKLNERELRRIIKESVNRILNEAEWQQGGMYPGQQPEGYENNGQGVERMNFGDRMGYNLRNTQDGYRNWHRISGNKGDVNSMSYQRFGNGGMDAGQLDSILDELAQYFNTTPEDIKQRLGKGR